MCQPPSFIDSQFTKHAFQLKKAIYGRKQASCASFHRFTNFLLTLVFHCNQAVPSMFILFSGSQTVILLLYFDDIVLIGSSISL